MKKTFKKLMAFAMVAVMMANPMSALVAEAADVTSPEAAKGSADASGDLEGFVDTSVFKVVLPTSAEGTFDFVMEPQGLIAATNGAAHTGETYASGDNVFFETTSGNYTKQSSYIEVLNKGTVAVNLSVEATVTGLDTVKMVASDASFTSGDAAVPELYLAFVASGDASGDAKDAPKAISTVNKVTSGKISATLPAASGNMYEYTYDASTGYDYTLKAAYTSGNATVFPDYSFALTGACNTEADWTNVEDVAPVVKVVWTLEGANSSFLSSSFVSSTSPSVTVTLPSGATTIKSVTLTKPDGSVTTMKTTSHYTYTNGTLKIVASSFLTSFKGGYFTITLDNGTTEKLTIQ